MLGDLVFDTREIVLQIPRGRVMSYGDIAELLGTGPRQIGRVMTMLAGVPWHRVVRADGTPASCHDGEADRLLRAEETAMSGSRVDMAKARWLPTDDPEG